MEFWQTYRLENTPEIVEDDLVAIGSVGSNGQLLASFEKEAERGAKGKRTRVEWSMDFIWVFV